MQERASSTITIYRKVYTTTNNVVTQTDVEQVTVPITSACRRRYKLMSEDCITLSFSLQSNNIYQPKIGDFVNDELFGYFYLASEALCNYNKTTGGYDYDLTFVRDYWVWNNFLLMFVATRTITGKNHAGQTIIGDLTERLETSWMLTDTLEGHCYMIGENLKALNLGNVTFHITADYADEVRFIAYENMHIIDAMNAIATEYECEWWVDGTDVYFGKCENDTLHNFCLKPTTINSATQEQNVESMTVSRDQQTYANKIAAFGSTKNLPTSYHRTLKFTVTEIYQIPSATEPIDTDDTDTGHPISIIGMDANTYIFRDANKSPTLSMLKEVSETVSSNTITRARATITYKNGSSDGSWSGYKVYAILYNDEPWLRFNAISTIASDFAVGTEFTLNIYDPTSPSSVDGLIIGKIPDAWWLDDLDNPSSLQSLGERRLMLDNIWVTPTGNAPKGKEVVEDVAFFENIFPRCFLRVKSAPVERPMKDNEIVEDGSGKSWEWTQYAIEVELLNGDTFPFSSAYKAKDTELEMIFVSEIDEQAAYGDDWEAPDDGERLRLLAGMTFKVEYNDSDHLFTIFRNEDYGAKLPNGTLKPNIGDVLVLTGWDVKAMNALGLVTEAEGRLATEAQEYVDAIQEGQFTFACNMLSQWPFTLASGAGNYGLPSLGDKVTVFNDALRIYKDGSWVSHKTSRIIAVEAKLDMPYDTPLVTVGETEAYSRLKTIERKMKGER